MDKNVSNSATVRNRTLMAVTMSMVNVTARQAGQVMSVVLNDNIQIDRWTDRQIDLFYLSACNCSKCFEINDCDRQRQTDRQAHRKTGRQASRWDRQIHRQSIQMYSLQIYCYMFCDCLGLLIILQV